MATLSKVSFTCDLSDIAVVQYLVSLKCCCNVICITFEGNSSEF